MRRQPEDLARLMAVSSNLDPAPLPRHVGCTIRSSRRATRPPRAVLMTNNKLTMPIREAPSRRIRIRPRSGKSIICCNPVDCRDRSGRNSVSCANNSSKSSHSPATSSLVASVMCIASPREGWGSGLELSVSLNIHTSRPDPHFSPLKIVDQLNPACAPSRTINSNSVRSS